MIFQFQVGAHGEFGGGGCVGEAVGDFKVLFQAGLDIPGTGAKASGRSGASRAVSNYRLHEVKGLAAIVGELVESVVHWRGV
jgi:hypothetical protein